MMYTLPIKVPVSGIKSVYLNLNQYRNWHYHTSNKAKIAFKELVTRQLDEVYEGKVEIDYLYYAPDKRKRDLMNVIAVADKFFQDTLVENGKIKTDDTETVIYISCQYMGIDKDNPRIEAIVKNHYL